jgi:3-deoxy-D-manno-octulosonate 8-phosphate phosphatase (KDO 8-P phosphatase)
MFAEALARKVRMLVLDVDGVLTDGGLYYDYQGMVSKRFHVQDGFGIKMAQSAGLEVAVITGLESEAVLRRITELGVQEYHAGFKEKVALLEGICQRNDLDFSQLAYIGDDWVDAAVLSRVGLPMTVANAQPEIKGLALWISSNPGGNGAVREAVRFILQAQDKLEAMWQKWQG